MICRRSSRAFTLFEVLLSIALTLALLGAMFAFFWDMLAARERAIDEAARRRAATALIDGIERNLFTSLVGDGVVGAGVEGDATSIRMLCRRVPAYLAERGPAPEVFADLERSEYRFRHNAITVQHALAGVVPGGRGAGARPVTLAGEIAKARFRYFDGGSWHDSFDSLDAGHLPVAVEVAVWYTPWPDELDKADDFDSDRAADIDNSFDDAGGTRRDPFGDAFDERDFAMESDFEIRDEPWPDRLRVIVLDPTATGVSAGGGR